MPHDRKGKLLEVGDEVSIPCRITAIHSNPDYCNVQVETIEGMHPEGHKSTFSLNTGQVEKVFVPKPKQPGTQFPNEPPDKPSPPKQPKSSPQDEMRKAQSESQSETSYTNNPKKEK
jgi:hypothetical protein